MFRNLTGTVKSAFYIGLGGLQVLLGNISKTGILQGQDADGRTVRDLVQYSPRWVIPVDYNQLATTNEVHYLVGAGELVMESNSTYITDPGSVVII